MPQGGMDEGESPHDTALRELEEETGIAPEHVEILRESANWLAYDLPDDLVPRIWGGKYRGQKQKWFAMRLRADDSVIHLDTAHPEFCEWKWVEMRELPDLIVPFKKPLYEQIIAEFSSLAHAA